MRRADLADLTAFVAVADNLSFRAAASHIGVTPSALSRTDAAARGAPCGPASGTRCLGTASCRLRDPSPVPFRQNGIAFRDRGTEGSNPAPSSAESIANSIFCGPASTTKQWPSLGTSSATRPLATHRERLRPGEPTDRVDHRESGGDGALRVVLTAKYMGDGVLIYFGYPQAPSSRTAARWHRAAVGGDRSRRFPGRVDPPAGPSLERAVSLTQSPAEI
jgi:hypothetical protein